MNEALADCVIERHWKRLHGRARRIAIDLDPTDDPTHGNQQFTFFNSSHSTAIELSGGFSGSYNDPGGVAIAGF